MVRPCLKTNKKKWEGQKEKWEKQKNSAGRIKKKAMEKARAQEGEERKASQTEHVDFKTFPNLHRNSKQLLEVQLSFSSPLFYFTFYYPKLEKHTK